MPGANFNLYIALLNHSPVIKPNPDLVFYTILALKTYPMPLFSDKDWS
jgi:hypothetical protein